MYHDTATDTALQFVLYIDSLIRFAENRGDASSNFVATNQLKIKTTCDKNRIQFLPISVVAIAFRRMARPFNYCVAREFNFADKRFFIFHVI